MTIDRKLHLIGSVTQYACIPEQVLQQVVPGSAAGHSSFPIQARQQKGVPAGVLAQQVTSS
ncbi:MAG: hypothetical protein K8R77_13465 [Anaerolineaceae bacterium]|nr:hypothetical protein [Anaerolineaceae bacterium]